MNAMELHQLIFGRQLIIDVEVGFYLGEGKPLAMTSSEFFLIKIFIFEAFRQTLVKKNRQNGERRKRSVYLYRRKKPSRDCQEKDH